MGATSFDRSRLPAYWRAGDARYALDGWEASGLSMAAFARQHGLRVKRLRWWRLRLEGRKETPEEPGARFVRLVVGKAAEPRPLRVHVGDVVIEVPSDFDAGALSRLVQVLSC